MLSEDFREFVALLNAHEVEYMIVGGYAVGIHGYPRYTGDLDVWVNREEVNAAKLVDVIREFGFGSLDISQQDFITEDSIIQLGYPPFRIDIVTTVDGIDFGQSYPHITVVQIDGMPVNVIGRDDLLRNKEASGRWRDRDDLENLMKRPPE